MNSIPPPAIIRGKQPAGINGGGGGGDSGIYYSTPAEMKEQTSSRGPSRILNEEGVFVTRADAYASQSSLESSQGVRPILGESTSLQRNSGLSYVNNLSKYTAIARGILL